jgi:hypothetical protein
MNRRQTGLLLALLLVVPCLAYAQSSTAEKKQPSAQMYEDIEVMRRILNRSLHLPRHATHSVWVPSNGLNTYTTQPILGLGALGNPALGALGNSGGGHSIGTTYGSSSLGALGGGLGALGNVMGGQSVGISSLEYPGAEGVYLKGHGVVFNLILPPQKQLKAETATPAPKTLSEWERIRKEVRGEKLDTEAAEKKPKEPSFVEVLLKVLAENGKHFTQLGPDETVTIVVTFRPPDGSGRTGNPIALDLGFPVYFISVDLQSYYQLPTDEPTDPTSTQVPKSNGPASPSGVEIVSKAPSGAAKDNVLLGDLHYKQNKYADAVKAYSQALEALDKKDKDAWAEVCQKVAQALLAEGKFEEAKKYLDWVVERKKTAAPAVPKKDPTPAPLPTKLILSATKKLLDQVGSGKMSFEDFKKDVSVEHYPSTVPEKDAGEKGGK